MLPATAVHELVPSLQRGRLIAQCADDVAVARETISRAVLSTVDSLRHRDQVARIRPAVQAPVIPERGGDQGSDRELQREIRISREVQTQRRPIRPVGRQATADASVPQCRVSM